jgi:hypothetical protein
VESQLAVMVLGLIIKVIVYVLALGDMSLSIIDGFVEQDQTTNAIMKMVSDLWLKAGIARQRHNNTGLDKISKLENFVKERTQQNEFLKMRICELERQVNEKEALEKKLHHLQQSLQTVGLAVLGNQALLEANSLKLDSHESTCHDSLVQALTCKLDESIESSKNSLKSLESLTGQWSRCVDADRAALSDQLGDLGSISQTFKDADKNSQDH